MRVALIDGDIVAWRGSASCEPTKTKLERESLDDAILRTDQLMYRILSDTQAEKHRVYLSSSENFRKSIYPDYKANRRKQPRPEWLDACREFLVREWGAEICTGIEADDGIGIAADENSIVCSIDKDLKQISGEHYNFVTSEFEVVDSSEAAYNLWASLLVGDSSDNVPGIDGIGKAKARGILGGRSPEEMQSIVRDIYGDGRRFILNYRLLKIIRSEQEAKELEFEAAICESQRQGTTEVSSPGDTEEVSLPNEE